MAKISLLEQHNYNQSVISQQISSQIYQERTCNYLVHSVCKQIITGKLTYTGRIFKLHIVSQQLKCNFTRRAPTLVTNPRSAFEQV